MDLGAGDIQMIWTALRDQHDNLLRNGEYKTNVDILMKKLNTINLQNGPFRLVQLK